MGLATIATRLIPEVILTMMVPMGAAVDSSARRPSNIRLAGGYARRFNQATSTPMIRSDE
jgi:hypothetical protein